MTKLIHITSPERALNIIRMRTYSTNNNFGHYDAGMNFLGVLGEYSNTQPTRGAKIYCEWHGATSNPLPFSAYDCHVPNILYDFNGSGNHFYNNDPRYFLPYDSNGVVVKKIELEKEFDEKALINYWAKMQGGFYPFFSQFERFHKWFLKEALLHVKEVNEKLASEPVIIAVKRR